MTTLSYHNDPELKEAHIAQAMHHLEADMLLAGSYGAEEGDNFHGCSVGCFAHEIDPSREDYHAVVAEAAGWPEWLVRLSDTLFEGLPDGERNSFHVELRKRVPVGVDLQPVLHTIAIARMDRMIALQESAADSSYKNEVVDALKGVREYHMCPNDESAAWSAWSAAWSAAESAWSAAWSAAESARSAWSARSAARSAAESAAEPAWSAAESAAESARSAAESVECDEYRSERDELFKALDECNA